MRIFWAIIALLAVAAAGAWYVRTPAKEPVPLEVAAAAPTPAPVRAEVVPAKPTPAPAPASTVTSPPPAPVRAEAPRKDPVTHEPDFAPLNEPAKTISETPPAKPEAAPAPAPQIPAPKQNSPAPAPAPAAASIPPAATEPVKPDVPKPDAPRVEPSKPEPAKVETPKVEPPKTDPAKPDAAKVTAPAAAEIKPADPKPASPTQSSVPAPPAKIEVQDDGSVLVDDKYPMRGKGTKDDPFRITWDVLVSAEQSYQPRLGKKQIPDRVKMLDGKWVRISGYIAFPLMAQSADEMLMMLNQWDGCCIGQPPTPYDAIEVKLKTPAKGDTRLRTTGALTGVLRVDPYLVKDWLVSLYVMDNGELSDVAGQATPGQHAGGGAPLK